MGRKRNPHYRWWQIGLFLIVTLCFAAVLGVWWQGTVAKGAEEGDLVWQYTYNQESP